MILHYLTEDEPIEAFLLKIFANAGGVFSKNAMHTVPPEPQQTTMLPRRIAISGILFSVLYIISLTLIRLSVPADPADPGNWLADPGFRVGVRLALNLVPFTGIAFLWFMAVLRNQIGAHEDRFFATVFLGSGLIFIATLFTATALAQGLLETFSTGTPGRSDAYLVGRRMAYALTNTYGMRMQAVFMFVSSTIGLRTGIFSRDLAIIGYLFGSTMLLVFTDFAWIALLFPVWALLISVYILYAGSNPKTS